MCEASSSLWPMNLTCPKSSGSCVDGFCQCKEGYQHDFTSLRLRDCRVPNLFLPIIEGIFIAIAFASLVYSLYYVRTAKFLARKIILGAVGVETTSLFLGIVRQAQQNKLTGITFFIYYMNMSFAFLCVYLSVYSMAVPLCKMSRTPIKKIEQLIKLSFVFFRIADAIPMLIAWGRYNEWNDPNNDVSWNKCSAIESCLYGIEMIGVAIVTHIYGFQMVKTIEGISNDLSSDNALARSNYLARVKNYLNMQYTFTPVMTVVAFSQPVVYLSSGYFPYTFVIYTLSETSICHFAVNQTKFAVMKKEHDDSNSPTKLNSSGPEMSNNHVVPSIEPKIPM